MATEKKQADGEGWSDVEREAMKQRAKETRTKGSPAVWLADVEAKIAEMEPADRALAERIHAIVLEHAPHLTPKTWYGMPSYADAKGKSVVFFQSAAKFKVRYSTLGFNEAANLDEGSLWPTSYALTAIGDADERRIIDLVKRAAG